MNDFGDELTDEQVALAADAWTRRLQLSDVPVLDTEEVSGIGIRRARPEDAEALAPLVYAAGRALHDYSLSLGGGSPLDYLTYALSQPGGVLGHRHLLVAEWRETPVGCIGAHAGWKTQRLFAETTWKVARFFGPRDLLEFGRRSFALASMQQWTESGRYHIGHCAVAEDFRGRGVFRRLFDAVEERARGGHYQALRLEVSEHNEAAAQVYEALGFSRIGFVPGVLDLPGVAIMEKPLA
ncbi:MAG: GNAT family N-acetyltransferase [Deltaproteobacteria bacterium]|nr:MAG: GNAT family N-acetyltransferase [Deltaproteobacteria bacterium]